MQQTTTTAHAALPKFSCPCCSSTTFDIAMRPSLVRECSDCQKIVEERSTDLYPVFVESHDDKVLNLVAEDLNKIVTVPKVEGDPFDIDGFVTGFSQMELNCDAVLISASRTYSGMLAEFERMLGDVIYNPSQLQNDASNAPYEESMLDLLQSQPTTTTTATATATATTANPAQQAKTAQPTSVSDRKRNLAIAYLHILDVCTILDLQPIISDNAIKLMKRCDLLTTVNIRNRSVEAIATAAVTLALRADGEPRSLQELATAAGIQPKELAKYTNLLQQDPQLKQMLNKPSPLHINGSSNAIQFPTAPSPTSKNDIGSPFPSTNSGSPTPVSTSASIGKYTARFCKTLKLTNQAQELAMHIGNTIMNNSTYTRGNPITVSAVSIYLAAQLEDIQTTQADVCRTTGITEATLRKVHRELVNNLRDLIPATYSAAATSPLQAVLAKQPPIVADSHPVVQRSNTAYPAAQSPAPVPLAPTPQSQTRSLTPTPVPLPLPGAMIPANMLMSSYMSAGINSGKQPLPRRHTPTPPPPTVPLLTKGHQHNRFLGGPGMSLMPPGLIGQRGFMQNTAPFFPTPAPVSASVAAAAASGKLPLPKQQNTNTSNAPTGPPLILPNSAVTPLAPRGSTFQPVGNAFNAQNLRLSTSASSQQTLTAGSNNSSYGGHTSILGARPASDAVTNAGKKLKTVHGQPMLSTGTDGTADNSSNSSSTPVTTSQPTSNSTKPAATEQAPTFSQQRDAGIVPRPTLTALQPNISTSSQQQQLKQSQQPQQPTKTNLLPNQTSGRTAAMPMSLPMPIPMPVPGQKPMSIPSSNLKPPFIVPPPPMPMPTGSRIPSMPLMPGGGPMLYPPMAGMSLINPYAAAAASNKTAAPQQSAKSTLSQTNNSGASLPQPKR